jgi:D-arabinonate dehydratase/D-galactarolactone cycloisomerase
MHSMKIETVETFAIRAKPIDTKEYWGARAWKMAPKTVTISAEYPPKQRRTFIYSDRIETVIVRITTDDGLVGWGEAKAPVAARATKQIIDELLVPLLVGADPRETTLLWERMYAGMRVRGHQAGFWLEAIAGVDIALWDIAGKAAEQPIHRLLGGAFRNPVRVYASGLPALAGDAPDDAYADLAEQARALRAEGFTAIKLALGRDIPGDIRSAGVLRDTLGAGFDLFADAAGCYDVPQALRIGKALEEMGFGFFEMPVPPEDKQGYARIAAHLSIPIALDSLMTRWETLDFLRRDALHLVQPDVCRAGGITECRRIAELADSFGAAFAPHVSIGSAIAFAASAHLGAAMPNAMTCEYWIGMNPLGDRVLKAPLELKDGRLRAPDGDGLGIEILADRLLAEAV